MPTIAAKDGTEIFYKDWGPRQGQPVVFSHGWPLSADSWEHQARALVQAGYRVVSYDRRGFGRSDQPLGGYDYDTLADDLSAVMDALELDGAALVGFSMGGGEIARYMSRHGGKGVERVAFLSSAALEFFAALSVALVAVYGRGLPQRLPVLIGGLAAYLLYAVTASSFGAPTVDFAKVGAAAWIGMCGVAGVAAALEELRSSAVFFKLVGSYPRVD